MPARPLKDTTPTPASVFSTPCTRVKSTLLLGSMQALRVRGHFERFRSFVTPEHQQLLFATGAPTWFPIAVAENHYAACDALQLPDSELTAIGALVAPNHAAGVAVLLRAAGATPWLLLEQAPRYWARMHDGGALTVLPDGPKEARMAVTGQPLARFAYWRVALRGVMSQLGGSVSTRIHVKEVRALRDTVTISLSWV